MIDTGWLPRETLEVIIIFILLKIKFNFSIFKNVLSSCSAPQITYQIVSVSLELKQQANIICLVKHVVPFLALSRIQCAYFNTIAFSIVYTMQLRQYSGYILYIGFLYSRHSETRSVFSRQLHSNGLSTMITGRNYIMLKRIYIYDI